MASARDHVKVTCEVRFGGIKEACARYSLGVGLMEEVGKAAGGRIKFGEKRILYDFEKIDKYLSSMAGSD